MLIKLLKYEVRATARLLLPLYGALLVFSVINSFLFSASMPSYGGFLHSLASIVSMVAYIILMVGMLVMTFVIMIQRFYKNLLGDEGYLVFTLPIQTWKHILSKLLIAMLWIISSGIMAFISIMIIARKPFPIHEFFRAIESMGQEFGFSSFLFTSEVIILALIGLAANIVLIYCAIALGHLFYKYRLLASFGMYILLNVIYQIIMVLFIYALDFLVNFSNLTPINNHVQMFFFFTFLYTGIIAASSFIVTQLLLKKKLNLE